MDSTQVQKALELYKNSVNFVLERDDLQLGHELYNLVQKVVKSDDPISDDILAEYKSLASQLRAHIYRRFPTRDIPKVFKNDIAHALHKPSYEVIKNVGIFLDRFKIGDDFSRQQRNIVNNLLDNKQRLTENSILVDDGKKVAPTVGNWIKYFYRKVGGQQTSNRIKIAEFFSKDSNILKLSKAELHKVKNLIQMQEYLRRPTDELRKELLEIMIDIGDGKIAVFENGDFSILFGIEEQSFVRNYFNKDNADLDTNGLSEVEALVKQTKAQRPKRTELKPVSSASPDPLRSEDDVRDDSLKDNEKPDNNIASENHTHSQVSEKRIKNNPEKKEGSLVDDLISDVLSQAPVARKNKSKSKEISDKKEDKKKNAQEIVQNLLQNLPEEQEAIGKTKKSLTIGQISQDLKKFFDAPEKFLAIALLQFIAEHNLWDQISNDPLVMQKIKEYDVSDIDKKIAVIIHTFLEKHDIMNATESARIAAQLTNYIHKTPEYKDIHLVYFDMATQSFQWYVTL